MVYVRVRVCVCVRVVVVVVCVHVCVCVCVCVYVCGWVGGNASCESAWLLVAPMVYVPNSYGADWIVSLLETEAQRGLPLTYRLEGRPFIASGTELRLVVGLHRGTEH